MRSKFGYLVEEARALVVVIAAVEIVRGEGQPALQPPRRVQLKSTDDLVCPTGDVGSEQLVPAEREIVVSSEYERIAAIIVTVSLAYRRRDQEFIGLVGECMGPHVVGHELQTVAEALIHDHLQRVVAASRLGRIVVNSLLPSKRRPILDAELFLGRTIEPGASFRLRV